ncbi:class I SAM-dependent methyltransferase [Sedimentibacter sp. zth1]|uniref:class I SAM-dependent DNA methyltransferase n=1 Tax=Sedimentibacter sp. zth1 TaxID=2816908 RepID=UPI001A90E694|nr:class I SAM-dependent methyltransferase [Sedimentibacter sp. zth1]QSX07127.1 class I SAM-dependent methyltransferase [Sedimentibacter sp. zth1]
MRQNFYKEFASIYDELMDDVDYEQWTSFITNELQSNSFTILEAACGTGNITSLLALENFNITAFDISEEMLIKAYDKVRRYRNVRILNQDMTKFKINSKFDACICCCDGLNYLNLIDATTFFKNVYEHLRNGGKFIFDISTKYKYLSMNDTYIYDKDNVFYVWENSLDEDNSKIQMEINFFVKDMDKYDRITEIQTHYLHDVDSITEILEDIGFTNIKKFDGYTQNMLEDSSIRATFICEKR